jgi:hypothetical protein
MLCLSGAYRVRDEEEEEDDDDEKKAFVVMMVSKGSSPSMVNVPAEPQRRVQ